MFLLKDIRKGARGHSLPLHILRIYTFLYASFFDDDISIVNNIILSVSTQSVQTAIAQQRGGVGFSRNRIFPNKERLE